MHQYVYFLVLERKGRIKGIITNDRRNNKSILLIAITKDRVKRLSSVLLEKYWPPIFSEQTIHAPTIYFWKPRGRIDHLFFFFFFKSIPLASRLLFSFERFSKYFSTEVSNIYSIYPRETILHSSFPCFLVQILECGTAHETRKYGWEKYFAEITTSASLYFINVGSELLLLLLVSIVDHLVMFRGRLMNPDRFPLIFRSVQFWLGPEGEGESRGFRPPKSQHLFPVKSSRMELNYGPRFAFYFPNGE